MPNRSFLTHSHMSTATPLPGKPQYLSPYICPCPATGFTEGVSPLQEAVELILHAEKTKSYFPLAMFALRDCCKASAFGSVPGALWRCGVKVSRCARPVRVPDKRILPVSASFLCNSVFYATFRHGAAHAGRCEAFHRCRLAAPQRGVWGGALPAPHSTRTLFYCHLAGKDKNNKKLNKTPRLF